jgi:hypothetical protein
MPTVQELIGILIVIAIIWVILKMVQVAIRLIVLIIGIGLVLWVVYQVFS